MKWDVLYMMLTFHSHAGANPPCILPSTWKLNCNYSLHSLLPNCAQDWVPAFPLPAGYEARFPILEKNQRSGICREDTKSHSTLCFGCNLLLLQTAVSTSDQKDLCNPNDEGGRWQLHCVTPADILLFSLTLALCTHTHGAPCWVEQSESNRQGRKTDFICPVFSCAGVWKYLDTNGKQRLLLEYTNMARNEWIEKEERFLAIFLKGKLNPVGKTTPCPDSPVGKLIKRTRQKK